MIVSTNMLRTLKKVNTTAQRFALMIVAVPSSYLFDTYFSGAKDEQTKVNARIKNVAKALACGLVGVGVRFLSTLSFKKLTDYEETKGESIYLENVKPKKRRGLLFPHLGDEVKNITSEALKAKRNKYIFVGANAFAALAMIFTNVFLDAPLTRVFTNWGIDKFGYPNKEKKEGLDEKA